MTRPPRNANKKAAAGLLGAAAISLVVAVDTSGQPTTPGAALRITGLSIPTQKSKTIPGEHEPEGSKKPTGGLGKRSNVSKNTEAAKSAPKEHKAVQTTIKSTENYLANGKDLLEAIRDPRSVALIKNPDLDFDKYVTHIQGMTEIVQSQLKRLKIQQEKLAGLILTPDQEEGINALKNKIAQREEDLKRVQGWPLQSVENFLKADAEQQKAISDPRTALAPIEELPKDIKKANADDPLKHINMLQSNLDLHVDHYRKLQQTAVERVDRINTVRSQLTRLPLEPAQKAAMDELNTEFGKRKGEWEGLLDEVTFSLIKYDQLQRQLDDLKKKKK